MFITFGFTKVESTATINGLEKYILGSLEQEDQTTVINKTKARARGFRPEDNDQRIYQAPIDMPKQGRL